MMVAAHSRVSVPSLSPTDSSSVDASAEVLAALPTLQEVAYRRDTEPARLKRALRGDLDWITLRAVEKERSRRYASVSELAADIERHLRNEPVMAGPPSVRYRIGKAVRRHRLGFAAGTVLLLLLVAGVVTTSWQAIRATRAEADAVTEKTNAEALAISEGRQRRAAELQSERASAVAELLAYGLGFANPANVTDRELTVRKMLELTSADAGTVFAGRPVAEAAARVVLGNTYMMMYDLPRSGEQLDRAIALLDAEIQREHEPFGPLHIDLHAALSARFIVTSEAGQNREALGLRLHRIAIEAARAEAPSLVHPLTEMQACYEASSAQVSRFDAAFRALMLAIEGVDPAQGSAVPLAANAITHGVMGLCRFGFEDVSKYIIPVRDLLDRCPQVSDDVKAWYWQMLVTDNCEPPAQNLATAIRLNNWATRALPRDNFMRAGAASLLGRALHRCDRREEAEPVMVEAYESMQRALGPEAEKSREIRLMLVKLYDGWKPELAAKRRVEMRSLPRSGVSYIILARFGWRLTNRPDLDPADYQAAVEFMLASLAQAPSETNSQHFLPDYLQVLGIALYRAGRHQEAIDTMMKCNETTTAAGKPRDAINWAVIAMAQHWLRRTNEATAALATAREILKEVQPPSEEQTEWVNEAVSTLTGN